MKQRTIALVTLWFVGMWVFRVLYAGNDQYDFLAINVLLAAVPLLLEPLFMTIKQCRVIARRLYMLLLSILWLLFMPNAFYLLTDFMHLNARVLVNLPHDGHRHAIAYARGDPLYMYDTLMLFAAAAFGAYAGALALLHAYKYFSRRWSVLAARGMLACLMILIAIGVYLGRFGRWNSWEGLFSPFAVLTDLMHSILTDTRRFAMTIAVFVLFQCMSLYVTHVVSARTRS